MTTRLDLHEGDNRESLRRLIAQGVRVDSVVCDPPYGLTSVVKRFGKAGAAPAKFGTDGAFARASGGFMGQGWDASGIERDPEFWRLVWEILKPGGYCVAFSSPRTGHWQAVAMELAGFVMHPFLGWVYGCMDEDTECLTREGWRRHADLSENVEVLQWDSASDRLTWTRPTAVHRYPYDGEMITISNRHTRQVLTPNHRVFAKVRRHARKEKATDFEVLLAEQIDRRPGNWSVDLPLAAHLVEGFEVDVTFAYLAGWWMTDAWAHRDANACMFSQSKPETLAKLRAALAPYGAAEYVRPAKRDTHSPEHTFYLTGPMADRLRSEFPDRKLSWEVLGWSEAARRALFDGLMDGDGSRKSPKAQTFWSKCADRRGVFLALCLSLGHRAYEDPIKGAVYLNMGTSSTQVQGRHRSERINYTGTVWCLTVPTGAFVVRRQGRPFITGNSGFPKDHDAARAIDREVGLKGEIVPQGAPVRRMIPGADQHASGSWIKDNGRTYQPGAYVPASADAAAWDGWAYGAQALKPALEPIYVAQKPFDQKNGAMNLLVHGVGALNIDGCRVGDSGATRRADQAAYPTTDDGREDRSHHWARTGHAIVEIAKRRHPANLLHDGSAEVVALFPQSAGQQAAVRGSEPSNKTDNCYGAFAGRTPSEPRGDTGSAARFFNSFPLSEDDHDRARALGLVADLDCDVIRYQAKAGKADRAGSKHPTVKPIALMEWLVRLVTPPGGTVLDPFAGSGTTGEAARRQGFACILMEAEPQYIEDIRRRFGLPRAANDLETLFGLTTKTGPFEAIFG